MQTQDKWLVGIGLAVLVYGIFGNTTVHDVETGSSYDSVVPTLIGVAMIAYSIFRKK